MMRRLLAGLLMLVSFSASAQGTFDYNDIREGRFTQRTVSGIRSMADGEHYTVLTPNSMVVKYSYATGLPVDTLFRGSRNDKIHDYQISPDGRYIMYSTDMKPVYRRSYTASHYIFDQQKEVTLELPFPHQQVPAFSPDSKRVAFVYENNLYYCDLNPDSYVSMSEKGDKWSKLNFKTVCDYGIPNRSICGHTDWVYEEEFGFTRAFEFSPDGSKIAFLFFDESMVRDYTIMRYDILGDDVYGGYTGDDFMSGSNMEYGATAFPFPIYSSAYTYKYPKAGTFNSLVYLLVYDVETDDVSVLYEPLEALAGGDYKTEYEAMLDLQYIPRFGWANEDEVWYYTLDRRQRNFNVMLVNHHAMTQGGDGSLRSIYSETDERYVEHVDERTITFLPDGQRFIVKNESSGFMHLYLYDMEKGLLNAITKGKWEVTSLVGVAGDDVYYISCEQSPLRRDLYTVKLNGKGKKRLTTGSGVNSIAASAGMKYYINNFSNATTPMLVTLHSSDGKKIRTLEDNARLREYIDKVKMPHKNFFTMKTELGDELYGYMIRPNDFDPSRKYPVFMTQYSGPGSQEVLDRWSVSWTDVLVQNGYVVVCVDGRGTGGRGEEFRKCTYGNLGALETRDQMSVARYLQYQPWVDASRIGIYGWSFGGFMTLNCMLKGAEIFKVGIAVAPVTSWRFYDTIYTELYNGMPQENAAGYDNNSPVMYADLLEGRLLMVHGTADDNVHAQNTFNMAHAFVKAGKKFDMMIYPDDNHSMYPGGRHHVMQKMIDYTIENL